MRSAILLACAALALAACKKASSPVAAPVAPPAAPALTDPLWAYAPAGTTMALVIADGALVALHAGAARGLAELDRAPGGAPIVAWVREQLAPIGIDVLDPAALAAVGVDLSRGAAMFRGPRGDVVLLPVSDPARLRALSGNRTEGGADRIGELWCKTSGERYVCSEHRAGVDAAIAGGGGALVRSWPREMRGHVEMLVPPDVMERGAPIERLQGMRLGAVIERGGVTVRARLLGKPSGVFAGVVGERSPLADDLAGQQPVGLLIIGAARQWESKIKELPELDEDRTKLPGGVTGAELVRSARGDLVGHGLPGAPAHGVIRLGLTGDHPMRRLVAACGDLAPLVPRGITLARRGDHCAVTVEPGALAPLLAGLPTMTFEAHVEPGALVIDVGGPPGPTGARPGLEPFAAELLSGRPFFAVWGRGVVGSSFSAAMDPEAPIVGLAVWAVQHLNELGLAFHVEEDGVQFDVRVRTLWANPDDVVAAVQAAAALPDPGAALHRIAAQHPDTPFARDLAAGPAGLHVQLTALAATAAVAVPSFIRYARRSKTAEARENLRRIARGARQHAAAHGGEAGARLPRPGGGPTPPLGACCGQGLKCAPDASQWSAQPWRSLGFSVDEPHFYSYSYEVDGDTFAATARGDLDCDGVYSTFTIRGGLDDAEPQLTVVGELE